MGGLTSGWKGDFAASAFFWSNTHTPFVASLLGASPILAAWNFVNGLCSDPHTAESTYQLFEGRVGLHTVEELAFPLFALFLFGLAHGALTVLDDGLFGGCGVHVTLVDSVGDLLPGSPALEVVLFFYRSDLQRCGLDDTVVKAVDDLNGNELAADELWRWNHVPAWSLRP